MRSAVRRVQTSMVRTAVVLSLAGATVRAAPPQVGGSLRISAYDYWDDPAGETPRDITTENDWRLTLGGACGDALQYSLTPQLRYDQSSRPGPSRVELLEDSTTRPLLTLHEGFLAWYGNTFEISAGKRIYNWGVGDGFNPTDNLNPRDWVDLPTADKIGVPSLSVYRYGRLTDVQLVVLPWFTPDRLPARDSRWFTVSEDVLDEVRAAFGFEPRVVDGGRELPDRAQLGARLTSSTLLDGYDLSLVVHAGHDTTGVLRGDAVPPDLILTAVYPTYQEVGASVSTTWGAWEVHAESAWHRTDDRRMDDDYIAYVAGVNRTWHGPLPADIDSITFTGEYAGEAVTRTRPADSPYRDILFSRGLTGTVLARALIRFSEDVELELAGAVNVEDGDSRLRTSLAVKPVDDLRIEAGLDVFEGPSDSFFGAWGANDRAYVQGTLYF